MYTHTHTCFLAYPTVNAHFIDNCTVRMLIGESTARLSVCAFLQSTIQLGLRHQGPQTEVGLRYSQYQPPVEEQLGIVLGHLHWQE